MRPVVRIAILICDPLGKLLDVDTIGRAPQVRRSNLAMRDMYTYMVYFSKSDRVDATRVRIQIRLALHLQVQ